MYITNFKRIEKKGYKVMILKNDGVKYFRVLGRNVEKRYIFGYRFIRCLNFKNKEK